MKKETFRYRILVEWSDEDQAFIARVPALPGCLAHGATAEKAAHEAEVAAGLILDVMKEIAGRRLPSMPWPTTRGSSGCACRSRCTRRCPSSRRPRGFRSTP